MLRYVDIPDDYEDDSIMFVAEDQCWDDATLKQLRDEYNVVFRTNGDGVTPIMVSEKWGIVLGTEDDGTIQFPRHYGQPAIRFSKIWADDLIADLKAACSLIESGKAGKA